MNAPQPLQRLLGGSAVLLVTANLANALHFAFHVLMARLLGPAGYGALAALMALLYVGYVLTEATQTVMARYTARATSQGEVRTLVERALRQGLRAAAVIAGGYLLVAVALSPLLRLPYPLMAVFALAFATLPLIPVTRGTLLGLNHFGGFGMTMLAEVAVKLGLGALAVWIGWNEMGAAAAIGLSLVVAFASGFVPLRGLREVAPAPAATGGAVAYGVPVLAVTATVMAFYSIDVLLARALFPAAVAGQYAVASLLGKGILLGVMPITRVMFPLASGAPAGSAARRRVLAATLGLLALCAAPALLLVRLFPSQLVRFAGGAQYGETAAIVLPVAAAMALMAFSNTLLMFRLSESVPRGWMALPALLLLEAALLWASRGSLGAFAGAVLIANAAFLLASTALVLQPAGSRHAGVSSPGDALPRSPAPSAPPPPRA
ncbi:MAG TPA: oligosaccharide flippase family protein [Thermoanaerobaculia bacterium]|nr:oligosaccharide flippase family protein [Thermoanaerobaculia bacterium]